MWSQQLRYSLRVGLLAGVFTLSVSVIGMVESFDERDLIIGLLTLGQVLLFGAPAIAGFLAARGTGPPKKGLGLVSGLATGFVAALPLVALIVVTFLWPGIRNALINISPALMDILTFGLGLQGTLLLVLVYTVMGIVGAIIFILPERITSAVISALAWTLGVALFADVFRNIFRTVPRPVLRMVFGTKGITIQAAIVIFVVTFLLSFWWRGRGRAWQQRRQANLTPERQRRQRRNIAIFGVALLLILPLILGTYLTEVVDIVGLFILMGLGLNIVVGFAGLLDLGYVAFFAIGAYTMGILTSAGDLGVGGFSFWVAVPIAIGVAVLAGVILGVPVLRMRGDYLAIVTLGFGEIIRVLAVSDLLKPYIGGAQGVLQIPKPTVAGFTLVQPGHTYYIILLGCALAAFVAWRLRDARLGRRWMAMREDEDVAEATGIHLVYTKLLAFALGAAFAGLAGAIFAARLGTIFPHSFQLLISINVLSLVIVGGIGSIPGVVVGALVLVGLPELLREFAEFRQLIYGALLIVMMISRPEGLWPSSILRRELHDEEEPGMKPAPAVDMTGV